jgi:predicted nucleic acid-binding protein
MKALDTSVLLAILHGEPGVRERLRRFRGVELATTELNLLELHSLVSRGPPRGRTHRREALERLRRSLTLLPLDQNATGRAARRAAKEGPKGVPWQLLGVLAILEANGCDELITADSGEIPGRWPFKVSKL